MPRKQKKFHFIYKTTNLVNNKFYVGMHSTDNLDDGYFGSGKIIRYSVNKHGIENHKVEILEFLSSREELKKREAEVVNEALLADPLNMNLKFGGEGGWDHTKDMDLISRQKKAVATKHRNCSHGKNLELYPEIRMATIASIAERRKAGIIQGSWVGKHHSEETKQKMRKTKNVGKANSQFGTCWICNETESKKIKKEELQSWLEQDWQSGRIWAEKR